MERARLRKPIYREFSAVTSRNQIVFSAEKPTDFRAGHARLIKITCFELAREKESLFSRFNLPREANEFQTFLHGDTIQKLLNLLRYKLKSRNFLRTFVKFFPIFRVSKEFDVKKKKKKEYRRKNTKT